MAKKLILALALTLSSATAQRIEAPRSNHGEIPAQPAKRAANAKPEAERGPGGGFVNNAPHVRNDKWYGHDAPNDKRYLLAHPFEHGRFEQVGPGFRYNVERFDSKLHRLWLPGGFYFDVAPWDWPLAADWCWTCGNDFVVYDDADHVGWYMLYNLHTGLYVHVQLMGH